MSAIHFSCLCFFLVYVHLTECRVLILRDYDDEPLVLDHLDRSLEEEVEPKQHVISINSQIRPKKMRSSKKAVLQYGRHIYHLDNFDDLKELRSKMTKLKPLKEQQFSYDYVDINDWKTINSATDGDYLKDILILSGTPLRFCEEENCEEDRITFRKYDDHKDWKHAKNKLTFIKRFQIVGNKHKSSKKSKQSKRENNHKKKKTSKRQKKKKKKYSSESTDSNSEERSSESWGYNRKENPNSDESTEVIRKHKKYDSTSADTETYKDMSTSIEDFPKIKKKTKKNYGSADETNRKTITLEDDFVMQGNKIFHSNDKKKKKKRHNYDKRRRLQHFMPKRFHWEAEEIHDLGYFWFNGNRGEYPAPKRLY